MHPDLRPNLLLLPAFFAFTFNAFAQDSQTIPQASYVDASHTTLRLEVDGKPYFVDVVAGTVRPATADAAAAALFAQRCSGCHGTDGRGIGSAGTPNFSDPALESQLTDPQIASAIRNGKPGRMPAFGKELNDEQISALTGYVRSFGATSSSSPQTPGVPEIAARSGIYQPGDDQLFTLPTGRAVDEHAVIVNFTHRFAYDSAITGHARGAELFGLDNFALSSFGVRYGVTDKLSVDVWRSPSFIGPRIKSSTSIMRTPPTSLFVSLSRAKTTSAKTTPKI